MNSTISQPRLRSAELLLRPFTERDIQPLLPLINDRTIAANTRSIPFPYREEDARQWIGTLEPMWQQGKGVVFAICLVGDCESDAELAGSIGLEINSEDENAELGYWLGRRFWNRGLCTKACQVVIDFGFEQLGLHRIHAHHMTRNPASGRVLEKIGMTREGILREHVKKWGEFQDIVFYGVLQSDWRSLHRET